MNHDISKDTGFIHARSQCFQTGDMITAVSCERPLLVIVVKSRLATRLLSEALALDTLSGSTLSTFRHVRVGTPSDSVMTNCELR